MANPPVVIGPFANVPAPGSPIKSDWPQEISTFVDALPKGVVGRAERTTDYTASFQTQGDVPGLSVAFTAAASRVYRTSITFICMALTSDQGVVAAVVSGSNAVLKRHSDYGQVNRDVAFTVWFTESGITGAQTRKLQIYTGSASQLKVYGTSAYTAQITVEDIGPASGLPT